MKEKGQVRMWWPSLRRIPGGVQIVAQCEGFGETAVVLIRQGMKTRDQTGFLQAVRRAKRQALKRFGFADVFVDTIPAKELNDRTTLRFEAEREAPAAA